MVYLEHIQAGLEDTDVNSIFMRRVPGIGFSYFTLISPHFCNLPGFVRGKDEYQGEYIFLFSGNENI